MLELVDRVSLSFTDEISWTFESFFGYNINALYIFFFFRGYDLIGKISILHIGFSGSSPDISSIMYKEKMNKFLMKYIKIFIKLIV